MTDKELFRQEYDCILRFHRAGAGGVETSAELTELVDRMVTRAWERTPEETRAAMTVVALGGYGRFEMCPHSDVDLMLLFADEETKRRHSDAAQKFLHSLWSLNFDIGHSVRTIPDCVNLYQTDVDVWASVLESRYVCGPAAVMEAYTDAMLRTVRKKQDLKFIASVVAGVDERHVKYEHSVKLLEPNLKNSAGGLRDLHSLLWIYRSADAAFFGDAPFRGRSSACHEMLEQFRRAGIVPAEEHVQLAAAFDFLLRIRNETHYGAGSLQDTLEFNRQFAIAQGLGYRHEDPVRAVEQCMREYFLHARAVYRINRRLVHHFRRSAARSLWSFRTEQVLDDDFMVRNGQLLQRNTAHTVDSPLTVLKGFYYCGLHGLDLSPSLQSRFDALSHDERFFAMDAASTAAAAETFTDLLRLPSNAAATLQAMNECGILGRFIPEWGELVAFFQHSMYHYYTTDAHTLIALEHAEKLAGSNSVLGETYRGLPRREILHFALLFHDIAKPQGVQGHEVTGAAVWERVRERFGFDDPRGDVAFLIRHHLVMEQVAFRRNTGDERTVREFAALFDRPERLDLLFVLTYCDLSAVNKNVWSSWKETLLQELYLRTRRLLRNEPAAAVPSYPSALRAHIEAMNDGLYPSLFTVEEMEAHRSAIAALGTAAVMMRRGTTHSTVTVVTRDRQFLLSTLCGVFTANNIAIIEAHIFTRNDGAAIDQFRVADAASKGLLTPEQETKVTKDLTAVLEGTESLEHLFERHRQRWRRRSRSLFHPNIRVDVVFHEDATHTIADVYAPDMTGFLYKVTQTISKAGLQISFAKLATRGDGIVDTFYISEYGGGKISKREQANLRERILHTISQLITVQMGEA
ncbi:MAG: [protein-PII] uridylyltransferase [Bacteroidetes bacterium]|nr:MAG: [protein-PII] uridylyltransferase [Bacteroidota bacterium]